jgi:hypothetical protein
MFFLLFCLTMEPDPDGPKLMDPSGTLQKTASAFAAPESQFLNIITTDNIVHNCMILNLHLLYRHDTVGNEHIP